MSNQISATLNNQEVVIVGTRSGFARLAKICSRLAELSDTDLNTPAGHFHLMPEMDNVAQQSMRVLLQAVPEGEWITEPDSSANLGLPAVPGTNRVPPAAVSGG
jgi:malonyl CoA-acyl carrier protein transacylase